MIPCIEFLPHGDGGLKRVAELLKPRGWFLLDVRNPYNEETKRRTGNLRTWKVEGGKYCLERHETDPETGIRTDEWITIDPEMEDIDVRFIISDFLESKLRLFDNADRFLNNGFREFEFKTIEGTTFKNEEQPY